VTLRYLAACFYDEPLRVYSKLISLGRSSATLDQAITGADGSMRALARMTVVRSRGDGTAPWSPGQLDALRAAGYLEGVELPATVRPGS
jgi:acyl-CoA thioesterase FadM